MHITLADGFLAAITPTGRSAEIGSLNKLSRKDRVAFAMSDDNKLNAIFQKMVAHFE